MTRDITPIKWIIGAIALLIIIAGACVLWYRYDTAPDRKAAADAKQLLRQSEIEKAEKSKVAEQAADAPVESNTSTAEKSINESTAEVESNTAAGQQNEASATNALTKDVPTSPFGLGPYPEVPADYPIPPSEFKWEFWGETLQDELMSRVSIKLWNQGIRSDGASFENGKVYPNILGTVYVEWSKDGDFIRRMTGHPDDDFDAIEAALEAGEPPPEGITILNRNEAGIDPYSFLELNQKE